MDKKCICLLWVWACLGALVFAACSTTAHYIDDLDDDKNDDDDDIDDDDDDDNDHDSETDTEVVHDYPATCQQVLEFNPDAADGTYTLYVGNDSSKPYEVHCHDMAGYPTEYLQLHYTDGVNNFSQYTAGGASPGSDVLTYYSRVRIHPVTLNVHVGDQLFSSSSGSLMHSDVEVTSMPYGTAMACVGPQLPVGLANINLTGTPFTVADGELLNGGAATAGESEILENGQSINIVGGGYCGWRGPGGDNPYNTAGGFDLQLVYNPDL